MQAMADQSSNPLPSSSPRKLGPGTITDLGSGDGRLGEHSTNELVRELLRRLASPHEPRTAISCDVDVSRAGWLIQELAIRATGGENRFGVLRAGLLLEQIQGHPRYSLERLRGANCLELGCGGMNPLAGMLTLLAGGAARCGGIDLEELVSMPAAARGLYDCAVALRAGLIHPELLPPHEEIESNLAGLDLHQLCHGDARGVPPEQLWYEQRSAGSTGLPDQGCDLVYSNSFLEHVADLDGLLTELVRISKPGSISVHAIDGTDHRHYRDANCGVLDFLTLDSEEPLVYGCNRERPTQVAERFRRYGFDVTMEPIQHFELTAEFRSRLSPAFADLSDEDLVACRALLYTTIPG